MKSKNFDKKIRKLEARIQKDMKKLAKVKQKMGKAAKGSSRPPKRSSERVKATKVSRTPAKKKRRLSPEGRAKLAALMKARWEAKRAAAQPSAPVGDGSPPMSGSF